MAQEVGGDQTGTLGGGVKTSALSLKSGVQALDPMAVNIFNRRFFHLSEV